MTVRYPLWVCLLTNKHVTGTVACMNVSKITVEIKLSVNGNNSIIKLKHLIPLVNCISNLRLH